MKNKKFLYVLLSAYFISYCGIGITQMYSMLWIYHITHSNFYLALQASTIFGAGVVGSLLYKFKYFQQKLLATMIISEFISGIMMLILAEKITIITLFTSLSIIYIFAAFYKPSFQALLGQSTSSAKAIKKINGITTVIYTSSLALGWLVAPLLFDYIRYSGLFLLDSVTYFCSSLLLLLYWSRMNTIKAQSQAIAGETFSTIQNINPSILNLFYIILIATTVILAVINGLEIGIFKRVYNLDNISISWFFLIWLLGGFISGFTEQLSVTDKHTSALYISSALCFALLAGIFSLHQPAIAGFLIYGFCGFLYSYNNILFNRLIYLNINSKDYSRYFNYKNTIYNSTMLITLPLIGIIAEQFSLQFTFMLCSLLAISLIALSLSRKSKVIYA